MEWPEPLDQDLPPPRPGEPPTLRSDILDEIADHLACAMDRERSAGHPDPEARSKVIHRFGNPAEIIRKLWFEAMKEQIMRDRVVIVGVIVMSLALVFIAWTAWNSQQLSRSRELALIQAIYQLRNAAQADQSTSDTLSSITFSIETETPISHLPGTVLLTDASGKERIQYFKSEGSVSFGPIPAGQYTYQIQTLRTFLPSRGNLYVGPGGNLNVSVPFKVDMSKVRSAYPDSSDGEDKEINALNTQLDKLKHEHFELSFELNDLENAFGKIGSGGEASGGHGEEAKRFEASQKRIDELRIERKNVESRMNQLEESIQKAKDSQAKAF